MSIGPCPRGQGLSVFAEERSGGVVTDVAIAKALPVGRSTLAPIDPFALGRTLAESGYFADVKSPAQAVVKILMGAELGIGPMRAMTDIQIVQGKPCLHYSLIGALIKRSGKYDYKVREHTEKTCSVEFFEQGESAGTWRYTVEDAERAGLLERAMKMWERFPRSMLLARALSNGARAYCSEAFGGTIYTPDELRDGAGQDAEPQAEPAKAEIPQGTPAEIAAEIANRAAEYEQTQAKIEGLVRDFPTLASEERFRAWFEATFRCPYDDQAPVKSQRQARAQIAENRRALEAQAEKGKAVKG